MKSGDTKSMSLRFFVNLCAVENVRSFKCDLKNRSRSPILELDGDIVLIIAHVKFCDPRSIQ
jgi:hypothetical protein